MCAGERSLAVALASSSGFSPEAEEPPAGDFTSVYPTGVLCTLPDVCTYRTRFTCVDPGLLCPPFPGT